MTRTSNLLFTLAMLFLAGCTEGHADSKSRSTGPGALETWGIKTADYNKAAEYWSDDPFYKDVPPPDCAKPSKDMKILCSRDDFRKIAWFTRRFYIYNEENARKIPIDHTKAYEEVYHSNCADENCLGAELKEKFYEAAQGTGAGLGDEDDGA